jgi:hypothetical protein
VGMSSVKDAADRLIVLRVKCYVQIVMRKGLILVTY